MDFLVDCGLHRESETLRQTERTVVATPSLPLRLTADGHTLSLAHSAECSLAQLTLPPFHSVPVSFWSVRV